MYEKQAERNTGTSGKLIEGHRKNPERGSLLYLESLFMIFMPGFDHKNANDEEYALRAAHLVDIRERMGKQTF